MMNKDQVLSLVRTALKVGGAVLVTKGLTDDAGLEQLVGALVTIGGLVWSMLHHKTDVAITKP